MHAIILAAGYGRRMKPLSDRCHKALLPIGGMTILGRIMAALRFVDVDGATVVTGYRADDVELHLTQEFPEFPFRFVRNDDFADTNNVVSLALALEAQDFSDDFILVECDLLFEQSLLERLVDHPAGNVALLDRYRTGMDGTVVSVSDGFVRQVFAPDSQGADFDYSDKFKTLNIYRFTSDFCRETLGPLVTWYAGHAGPRSYYELVLGMLTNIPEHRIAAEIVDGSQWVEVDDPNDLAIARFQFEPDRRDEVLDRAFGGFWTLDLLDFSFMRNAYFPTDAMLAAMRHALPELIGSYGSAQAVLNEKMSFFLACDASRLQVLNGASQVFPILREWFAGSSAAIPSPTFGEYARAFPGAQSYTDAPGVDWDTIERLANDVDVIVIVNPNSPTGTTLATRDISTFAKRHPDTTVIVDESFLAFTDEPSVIDSVEHEELDNLVVIASLSKVLGAPGLRLGYVYSRQAELIDRVGASLPVWNLNAPAEFLLELLLKFRIELRETFERTKVDREALRRDLASLAIVDRVHESGGNYVLVDLRAPDGDFAVDLRRRLLSDFRIEVKNVTDRFLDGTPRLRLAVRRPEDNERLVTALRAVTGA